MSSESRLFEVCKNRVLNFASFCCKYAELTRIRGHALCKRQVLKTAILAILRTALLFDVYLRFFVGCAPKRGFHHHRLRHLEVRQTLHHEV
jgi:hypothetical protein